jgi:hypothetical protein
LAVRRPNCPGPGESGTELVARPLRLQIQEVAAPDRVMAAALGQEG